MGCLPTSATQSTTQQTRTELLGIPFHLEGEATYPRRHARCPPPFGGAKRGQTLTKEKPRVLKESHSIQQAQVTIKSLTPAPSQALCSVSAWEQRSRQKNEVKVLLLNQLLAFQVCRYRTPSTRVAERQRHLHLLNYCLEL